MRSAAQVLEERIQYWKDSIDNLSKYGASYLNQEEVDRTVEHYRDVLNELLYIKFHLGKNV
jgi:hypothetical protein